MRAAGVSLIDRRVHRTDYKIGQAISETCYKLCQFNYAKYLPRFSLSGVLRETGALASD